MDIVKFIFNLLTDVNRRLRIRIIYGLLIFIVFFFIDNFLGLSYFYQKEKKINQVSQISFLLKDTTLDKKVKEYLEIQQKEIIERKDVKDYFFSLVSKVSFKNSANKKIATPIKASPIKNDFWMFFWTNIFIFLIMVVTPFFAFKDKSVTFLKGIFVILIIEIIFIVIAILQYLLIDLIPVLFQTPTINYVIAILYNLIWVFISVNQAKK